MENEFKVCQSCGEQNDVSNSFCKKCAKPLNGNPQPQQVQPQYIPPFQQPTAPPKKKGKGCLIAVIVVLVIIAIAISSGNTKDDSTPNANENVVTTTKENKVPIVVTVDTLVDALSENALKASTTYKGKYVELTGKVTNIDSSGDYFSLGILSDKFSLDSVLCKISKDQMNTVSNFKTGQKVTVIGDINSVGEVMGYTLQVETIK